jgi:truncated hemoglobin YjbI
MESPTKDGDGMTHTNEQALPTDQFVEYLEEFTEYVDTLPIDDDDRILLYAKIEDLAQEVTEGRFVGLRPLWHAYDIPNTPEGLV